MVVLHWRVVKDEYNIKSHKYDATTLHVDLI
jgi:hypothetical protein